jgi:hypothetical protein
MDEEMDLSENEELDETLQPQGQDTSPDTSNGSGDFSPSSQGKPTQEFDDATSDVSSEL